MHDQDWKPTASWANLRLRGELLQRTRSFFDDRNFLEVETPFLSADTTVDRHLDPLAVTLPDDPRRPVEGRQLWLQTSPEFAMKRLIAAGGQRLYQITRAFRAGERGAWHNPEFTIVEWYRRGDSMREGMRLLSDLVETLLGCGPAVPLSYQEAFRRHAEIDPLTAEAAQLAGLATASGLAVPATLGDDRDEWLDFLLAELVLPRLDTNVPTILYDYPTSQAMLAAVRNEDPPVAERFELIHKGIELANGYHELQDADALRDRVQKANAARRADGKVELPSSSRLWSAMEAGLPDCTGVALGFDRIVMLAARSRSIEEVIPFPIERA
ncbi:MAG: EF-P lysine aminoacylase GenX [Planctomycetales bacterium]|nr:EF-P lysine aminoacylase GenX [Planctomycetales bacterium]NIM09563.1 EF-P lysine aminoacylase GenX [Planctomycetales bacterium]NIN09051.1 EF-P lysine aminoacylase GenX [Planctomycetales bacterium]NIN78164.1 EF-P lysine aminoacylase GenX [Planctomycetales bacterium]NIO35349.1 EF-P lysine aminoacylase GenX [Planctomycetales bacterium]